MDSIVERRPHAVALGVVGLSLALAAVARLLLEHVPWLTVQGLGLVLNWLWVIGTVALVARLGWWGRIRLFAPVERRALIYLLPLAAIVALPVVFGMSVREIELIRGQPLPAWASVLYIVVGIALGAAIFEELLHRGVLLRAFESRGRLYAAVVTSVVFALTHLAQVIMGGPAVEWLVTAVIIVPAYVGVAAITFRLDSLWPVVLYHFAVDVTFLHAAAQPPAFVVALLGLNALLFVLGVWLLRGDDRRLRAAGVEPARDGNLGVGSD